MYDDAEWNFNPDPKQAKKFVKVPNIQDHMRQLVNSGIRRRNSDILFESGGSQIQKKLPLQLLESPAIQQLSMGSAKVVRTKTESDERQGDSFKILKTQDAQVVMRHAFRLRSTSRLPSMDNSVLVERVPTGSGTDRNKPFEFNRETDRDSKKGRSGLPNVSRKTSVHYVQLRSPTLEEISDEAKSKLVAYQENISGKKNQKSNALSRSHQGSAEIKRRPKVEAETTASELFKERSLKTPSLTESNSKFEPFRQTTAGSIRNSATSSTKQGAYALKDSIVPVSRRKSLGKDKLEASTPHNPRVAKPVRLPEGVEQSKHLGDKEKPQLSRLPSCGGSVGKKHKAGLASAYLEANAYNQQFVRQLVGQWSRLT